MLPLENIVLRLPWLLDYSQWIETPNKRLPDGENQLNFSNEIKIRVVQLTGINAD